MTRENTEKLKRLSYDCRTFAHIHTLDRLADWASWVLHDIDDERGGTWNVPLRAYSHKDLVDRKPPETFYWLDRALRGHPDADYLRRWHSWDYPGSEFREDDGADYLGY